MSNQTDTSHCTVIGGIHVASFITDIAVAILFLFIFQGLLGSNFWLFVKLIAWQSIHMYVIGRKDITFRNFDGLDLFTGCFALYFFFTTPMAYVLSFGLIYLVTGKRSIRR